MSSQATISESTMKESKERQTATLKNIQQLQEMEKELYTKLEASSANGSGPESQEQIIQKINELSQIRMTMFSELDSMYQGVQGRVAQSRIDLVDQMVVTGVVENELNNAKRELNALQADKANKMRMVEINTYYSQQYRAQTSLMKLIIIVSLIMFVLAVVAKQGWIPGNIINGIMGLVGVVGGFLVIRTIINISSRSNMNFDEFNWAWDRDANDPTVYEYDQEQLQGVTSSLEDEANSFADSLGLGCVGSNCCAEGTIFDNDSKRCVEGFSSNRKSVSYVEDPSVTCPWKERKSVVVPFSKTQEDYVRI